MTFQIRDARSGDEAVILAFIKELAGHEKLACDVVGRAGDLTKTFISEALKVHALANIVGEDGVTS